jgi:hypothetical protein
MNGGSRRRVGGNLIPLAGLSLRKRHSTAQLRILATSGAIRELCQA